MVAQHSFQPDYHYDTLILEFKQKNEILSQNFPELSPEEYIDSIFSNKKEFIVILGTLKDKEGRIVEEGTVFRVNYENLWDLAWRSNAYIPYADFRKNYYSSKTLEKVRAFVVDLDGVSSRNLNQLVKYVFRKLPKPSYLVNSGKGIHLIYALDKPVKVKGLRWTINTLNSAIQSSFDALANLDKHPVIHPYRLPGFATKLNTKATVFRVGKHYELEELLKLFNVPQKKLSKKKTKEGKTEKKGKLLYVPNGSRAFWEWFIWKLFKRPPIPGYRHNSFFALGIVSYKCKLYVPEEEAKEVVDMVYDGMERKNLHIGFTREEAHKAFEKGYNPKAVTVRWKYICELLDWEYRPNKRNGRKREEHIKLMNRIRLARYQSRWEEIEEHIKRLIDKGYKKSEIAEIVGISRVTLWRRFKHLWK